MVRNRTLKAACTGITLTALSALPLAAAAQNQLDYYLGGGVGGANFDGVKHRHMGAAGRVTDEDDTAWRLFGGGRDGNVALELGYIDFNELTGENAAGRVKGDAYGVDLSVIGFLPIAEQVELFGKVGAYYWSADVSSNSPTRLDDGNSWDGQFGLGAQIKTAATAFRVDWTRYMDLYDRVDTDAFMGSVIYKF